MMQNQISSWGRRRRRRRYFTRHPITGLNFNKTISKPYYNQAILKKTKSDKTFLGNTEAQSLIKIPHRLQIQIKYNKIQSNHYKSASQTVHQSLIEFIKSN
jgi:hypothetical protein